MTAITQNSKKIIVKKFGGATVASPEKIKEVALRIKQDSTRGDQLIIVVSAMGKTTNNLIELANLVSSHPNQREMDMLLSVGERISMSLLSMALLDLGLEAISFTGSQAGILTNDSHENAKVIGIKPIRLLEEMKKNKIIILAGFQGVSAIHKEITTLGRGGSDTSAVAISAALGSSHCEILKDVPAIYSADPNLVTNAHPINNLSYEELMEMTFWGAKVLHYRSAELAAIKKVELYIGPSKQVGQNDTGTWIKSFKNKELDMVFKTDSHHFESAQILSINAFQEILRIKIKSKSINDSLDKIRKEFQQKEIIFPQILNIETQNTSPDDSTEFLYTFTAPAETLTQIKKSKFTFTVLDEELASLTLTCTGLPSFEIQEKIFAKLNEIQTSVIRTFFSSLSLVLILKKSDLDKSIKALHQLINL
jgi:aspartate kinase